MKKYAEDLAKEYDWEVASEYYDYIIESLVNGQRQQVKKLFNRMKPEDQNEFLTTYLDVSTGHGKSVLNICIGELTK